MKFPALLSGALAMAGAFCPWLDAQTTVVSGSNGVASTVNGKVITKGEVAEFSKFQLMLMRDEISNPKSRAQLEREARDRALQDLVDRELIISEFERMGAKIKPQYIEEDIQRLIREDFKGSRDTFMQQLKRQGLSWTRFKELHEKKLIVAAMRSQATQNVGFATPGEKQRFFQENPELFREEGEVWLKTISVPVVSGEAGVTLDKQRVSQERLANDIRRQLLDGADFSQLARTHSHSQRSTGGDWGWVARRHLGKQLADRAFTIPVRTISPVFEFNNFFFIITVEERKLGKSKSPAEIEELLNRLVQVEKKKRASEEWLAKLRRKALITYPDPDYRPRTDLASGSNRQAP
jgi:parvulin-like peptidyl-prolyl isomerase